MENEPIKSMKLEVHQTKDVNDQHVNGKLTVVWRDWDDFIEYNPKMVYISSVNPGEKKGPHLHTIRDSYFVCIRGKVVFRSLRNAGPSVPKCSLWGRKETKFQQLKSRRTALTARRRTP